MASEAQKPIASGELDCTPKVSTDLAKYVSTTGSSCCNKDLRL
jgi:hypothetical protein